MVETSTIAEGIFWFTVFGSGAAAVKHLLTPTEVMEELTPVAVKTEKAKKTVSPEAMWWGSYAFSAMNAGYCTVGLWAAYTGSDEAKQAFLLGTGILFEAFSLAWFTRGQSTGKKDFKWQGTKIGLMGALFLAGFGLKLIK